MGVEKFGLKALTLAAAIFMVAACETAVEESSDTTGAGGAAQQATTTTQAAAGATSSGARGVVPGSQEDLVLNVGDRIFFEFDRSDLTPESRATVERWASWLKQYPEITVTVEGHADERGTREYNLGLGERRSNSAKNYLIALGVNPDRVGVISYGKERPVCVSSNEGCWSQNRRDVLVVN
jgi:peptidoglycan-associated lipoprotein